jgi:hypothetical protein
MSIPSWLFRAHRFSRLPRLTKLPLGVEITLLLAIKISLLTVLAKTCFSEPQAKHMRMPIPLVEQHLLMPATPVIALAPTSSAAAADSPRADDWSDATTYTSTPTEVTHGPH